MTSFGPIDEVCSSIFEWIIATVHDDIRWKMSSSAVSARLVRRPGAGWPCGCWCTVQNDCHESMYQSGNIGRGVVLSSRHLPESARASMDRHDACDLHHLFLMQVAGYYYMAEGCMGSHGPPVQVPGQSVDRQCGSSQQDRLRLPSLNSGS